MITEAVYKEYLNGNCADAWREIAFVKYGNLTLAERVVVDKIMQEALRRIEQNVAIVWDILRQYGYRYVNFGDMNPFNQPVVVGSPSQYEQKLAIKTGFVDFEEVSGHLPLFFAAFISRFDVVDFRGEFEGIENKVLLDALYVDSFSDWSDIEPLTYEVEFRERDCVGYMFTPDQFHKENVSGDAGPFVIIGEELQIDNFVVGFTDDYDLTFLEYLRFCFHWACLPNLHWLSEKDFEPYEQIVREVRARLLQF
ncbi:hypothetical protein [Paraflavitalea sp. CAU 1676]|uniref:hypothetical protein n=1 Tax=Paraflavitalea sp. CAU 1676 TaxID=3032598 RepID=UPI0023DC1F53|nr:hypothetical protein [Paraflavitalea sp. CAU 1676]MDF2193424.1 hypothetical protein [Paraflavitalea sp. CAU 1676]